GVDALRPVALVQVPPLIESGEAATASYDKGRRELKEGEGKEPRLFDQDERAIAARTSHRLHRHQWKYLRGRSIISWEHPFPRRPHRVTKPAGWLAGWLATLPAVVVAATSSST
ncbi:uncharacterized protein, partial [Linepithema humile]|uniref:uncharacterized protein n=1 Tax=Linepithema humile TaxID=83485 RepID=UPI00351F5D4C